MHAAKTILFILLCVTLLGACGLRGPLYLEDETQPPATGQDPATGADEGENSEEDKEGEKKNTVFP